MADLVAIDEVNTDRVVDQGDDLTDLMESIERKGIQVPVLLTQDYDLVDGLRRIEAARRLGMTHIEAVATYMYPRACEVIRQAREHGEHAHPMSGKRVWEISEVLRPLLFTTRSHYSRGKPKGKGNAKSAGGRKMLVDALGLPNEGVYQAITQVHRALSNPELAERAAEALRMVEAGETTHYGALHYLQKKEGLGGDITTRTEQLDVLDRSALSLRGAVRALERIGPLHDKLTAEEAQEKINALAYIRTRLNKIIKTLQEENNKR